MQSITRPFVLIASALFDGDLTQAQVFRETLKKGEICFAEYAALIDWLVQMRMTNIWESYSDPIHKALAAEWNRIAATRDEDIDDTNDPEWIAVDRKMDQRYEEIRIGLLKKTDKELFNLHKQSERAYLALCLCGSSSLHADPKVIPGHALLMPEEYELHFHLSLRSKAA